MGGPRSFLRAHEFLICVDVDGVCLAPSGDEPLFDGTAQAVAEFAAVADIAICSRQGAAPAKALWNQWRLHAPRGAFGTGGTGESGLTKLIANGYAPPHMLMVGATRESLEAAGRCGVPYYPILPGRETLSWQRLREEALPKLLHGSFSGEYQRQLIVAQQSLLSMREG